jgi:hypothetical protein
VCVRGCVPDAAERTPRHGVTGYAGTGGTKLRVLFFGRRS